MIRRIPSIDEVMTSFPLPASPAPDVLKARRKAYKTVIKERKNDPAHIAKREKNKAARKARKKSR